MSVELSIDEGVAEVVLNRPDKMNALDDEMIALLTERLDEAERSGARALVIRGEGRAFCAGRDLAGADPLNEDATAIIEASFNPLVRRVADFPAPSFAAVHGACLGAGLGLALACDVVFIADDARIGSPFAKLGAVMDSGGHAFMVDRIGAHRTLELIYTGRLISGREAAALGLVNRSVGRASVVDNVRQLAAAVAVGPTTAFVASKRIVRRITEERLGLTEVLHVEAEAQGEASRSHDYREGITSFQEKRSPNFTGA